MSAITQAFARAHAAGRAAFIPYLTGGYPDQELSLELGLALGRAGADLLEIGIPFSDPMADGPVIQKTSQAALEAGATPAGVLALAARIRNAGGPPVVIMSSYTPIRHRGLAEFAADAAAAGVAGVVVPDLPPRGGRPLAKAALAQGLDSIAMAPPPPRRSACPDPGRLPGLFVSSCPDRSDRGQSAPARRLPGGHRGLRARAALPVAVGFGVAGPKQARALAGGGRRGDRGHRPHAGAGRGPSPREGLAAAVGLAGEIAAAISRPPRASCPRGHSAGRE